MGTHLFNYFKYIKNDFNLIPFKDEYFNNKDVLKDICRKADVIVHLAALNRHNDPDEIYRVNIDLVNKVINSCEDTGSKPHLIFASSTQEERDNTYGKSKKEGRKLFETWAKKNESQFTGLIIPNVFGPFGNPYYNSVIATFSHQLTHNEKPKIDIDGELKLIYINELIEEFYNAITNNIDFNKEQKINCYQVPHSSVNKVSEILTILERFKLDYFDKGIIPVIKNNFELNLFNTFRCYISGSKFPFNLNRHSDDRGAFVEIIRTNTSGQFSYSSTKPGITRGNHFHTRKIERFSVVKGKARIELRRVGTNEIISYDVDGENPSFVDMPIWYTHNITNTGVDDLYTLFWINEPYNVNDPDTFFEKV